MKLFPKNRTAELRRREHPALYVLLSFFLPLIIQLIALAWLKVTPFGDKTLLIADANGLYINYLGYVGRMVKGAEGFLYSFEKGLGGNMLPNIGITMLDPFFPLFALFEPWNYPGAFTLVSILNLSFCGLTMYLLLAELYGHKQSNLVFSTSYALMGFNVANVFQVFFFTGAHVLPLLVMGLRRLLREKSPALYILVLGYAVLTSYYFGFMLCVASVLFFFLYLWLHSVELEEKRRRLFFKYAISSVCGGLLGAMIWLPAILGISGGRLEQTRLTDFSFMETAPLLQIGAKLFTGANSVDEVKNGLPNIFVGILPLALVILFFLRKETDKRKKTAAGIVLGFYLLCFYIIAFNMLMHGGTVTNWFNFRYSFVFSFLLLLIAAEEWQMLDTVSFADCKKCGGIMLLGAVLIFSVRYGFVVGGAVVLDFGLLLVQFAAYAMHRRDAEKNPRRVFEALTLLICCFQLLLNYYVSIDGLLQEGVWLKKFSEYQGTVEVVAPLAEGLTDADPSFFRMEVNQQRSRTCGNDPMLYGYNGVGHSGSYERDFVRSSIGKLGVHWFQTRNYYQEGIPTATDTLLGLKYILAQENLSEEKGYPNLTNINQITLFKGQDNYDIFYNPYALSVAFLSNASVNIVELGYDDVFDNLNQTWAAISGEDTPVFIGENEIIFEAHNLFDEIVLSANEARASIERYDSEAGTGDNTESENQGGTRKEVPEYTAYIEYQWTAKRDGAVYTYNRGIADVMQGSRVPVLEYLGNYRTGETVKAYIPLTSDYVNHISFEEIAGRFRAAYADNDALHELATIVKNRPCTIEKVKDSHLRGEFTAEAGQKLMFTIPYDEGWTCFIDGKEAEIKKVLGVFMAVDAPEGTHSYEMKFFPVGMKNGIGLSAAALLTTLVYIPVDAQHRKRRAPVPKVEEA